MKKLSLIAAFCGIVLASNANTYAGLLHMDSYDLHRPANPDVASPRAPSTLPFSASFEVGDPGGYTNNTQLATQGGSRWTGNGQDTSGWLVTSNAGLGGPSDGSQWVLASAPTNSVLSRWQWMYVNPSVTDFSVDPVISGSSDVKIINDSGNRNTRAGLQMYTEEANLICSIYVHHDIQNVHGFGAGRMIIEHTSPGGSFAYDAGPSALNDWANLRMDVDFTENTCTGYHNNTALPNILTAGGFTDYHDIDLFVGRGTTTSGGKRSRAGFDNYSVSQIPEPGTLALLTISAIGLIRRRR